ncbi:cell division protein ZipA [Vibrio cholerae]
MQELRFVLIIVGALAIAALLFHGLWTSKKEGKTKFGNKPIGKLATPEQDESVPERSFAPEDDFEIVRVTKTSRNTSNKFASDSGETIDDPLLSDPLLDASISDSTFSSDATRDEPTFSEWKNDLVEESQTTPLQDNTRQASSEELDIPSMSAKPQEPRDVSSVSNTESAPTEIDDSDDEDEMQVIVINVHCAGETPFVGTKLFDSMQQNGLIYGEMDIFHRHADLSGTGKVLFSVANMMHPGTLKHDDPATFTTKGISFFMTLPCYGDGEQNFKLMLKTAQQIADDLGANVMDDARNLMTPNRLDAYRAQIKAFKLAQQP